MTPRLPQAEQAMTAIDGPKHWEGTSILLDKVGKDGKNAMIQDDAEETHCREAAKEKDFNTSPYYLHTYTFYARSSMYAR